MKAVDLFAGAGGCSTGLLQAATKRGERVELVAVNHWPISVETHTRNHPEARHFCASIETLDPKVAVPGGKLDLLIAAPECVFHSTARGGKPIDDQRRASAWHVLRWLEHLHVEEVLIENVPEFVKWGPLGKTNRPLKAKRGEIFRAFIAVIESLNYRVEWKVLNAADFGAATTRRRLFIRASRGGRRIAWPEPTHSRAGSPTLFGGRRKWRAAREIIDWSLPSQSIFTRKRPLQPATIRRILEGLRRFGGDQIQPFLVQLTHGGRTYSVDNPMPTVTSANRGEVGVVEPFVLSQGGGGVPRPVGEPMPTIVTDGAVGLVEAEVAVVGENRADVDNGSSPRADCPGCSSRGVRRRDLEGQGGKEYRRHHSSDAAESREPVGWRLSEGQDTPERKTDERLRPSIGVDCDQWGYSDRHGRQPYRRVQDQQSPVESGTGHSLREPPTRLQARPHEGLPADQRIHAGSDSGVTLDWAELCEDCRARWGSSSDGFQLRSTDFLAKFYGTATVADIGAPVPTITSRDRFALVQPVVNGYTLDVRFRMLQPHELAAAMSFPAGYSFAGNKGDTIRQIGNAVDCRMAEALCGAILDARKSKSKKKSDAVA